MTRQCAGCEKVGQTKFKQCAVCKSVLYCSEECQRVHWPVHKLNCSASVAQRPPGCKRKLLSESDQVCVKRLCTSTSTKSKESITIEDLLDGKIHLKEYWPMCPCGYRLSPWTCSSDTDPHSHFIGCNVYGRLDPIVQQRLSEELGRLL